MSTDRGGEAAGHSADSSVSRPSLNNCHGGSEGAKPSDFDFAPSDLPDAVPALRPISVHPETSLRDEAVMVETEGGMRLPKVEGRRLDEGDSIRSRPTYRVLNEFREWYRGYESAHLEYDSPEGETVRTPLENSYQPEYANRYYARLKAFEREVKRQYESLTTAMLTFSASHENANGNPRCPADHMREIADGWDTARKLLHKVLSGREWEYVRIWEPHQDGYGHLHVGIFVEGGVDAVEFEPVMETYVNRVKSAGTKAHTNDPCSDHMGGGSDRWDSVEGGCDDCHAPVSVNSDVSNLGTYLSEYLGAYGEPVTDRPVHQQVFYAVTWATNTRRLDFSNGAQRLIELDEFRRETGLNPEDRGGGEAFERWSDRSGGSCGSGGGDSEGAESVAEGGGGDGEGWTVDNITYVSERGHREKADPTSGGVAMSRIEGRPDLDPPAVRE